MYQFLIYILFIFSINQSVFCSYRNAGCFTQVFHDSYFTSSFMEPTLCFRLCDTPIIYLQKTVCRCSGGGLTDQNRQIAKACTYPCTQPVDRSVKTSNKCGGPSAYSAYVQEKFYSTHGHLFDYQIKFSSCETWRKSDVYDTSEIILSSITVRSSLNKLEQCAAACLDQNATTKSIAFNGDSDRCTCIMPLKSNKYFEKLHYITIEKNSACDLYCNNTAEGVKTVQKYQCGSINNSNIRAIYDLNGTCPLNFIYIKDLKKCVYTYKNFWNSCTLPSSIYTFDGSLSWASFLKMIETLHLNDSIVTVDFDETAVIDASWKCSSMSSLSTSTSASAWRSYLSHSRSSLYGWSSSTRYILENGCLTESSYSSYSHRYSYRICVADPIDRYSSFSDDGNETYIASVSPIQKFCPTNWFDLNGRCYRISDERKTIDEARDSCINVSSSSSERQSNLVGKPRIWSVDSYGNLIDDEEFNESPTGNIVEYISEWQARLGFFLLDTDPDSDNDESDTTTSTVHNIYYDQSFILTDSNETVNTDHSAINEFQVIDSNDNNNSSYLKNTCVLITRSISEEEERPIIRNIPSNNCSKPRHALCETNTLVVQNFLYGCFSKPKALDLPALISDQLTHELCLSVCQELQTKLAILNLNKCYCVNGASPSLLNITTDFSKYEQKSCGKTCPGNSHELCGDDNTIVAFQILDSRRTFTFSRTPPEPFPNYVYDSCVRLNSFNQSAIYRFTFTDLQAYHPRYCLTLCTKYKQKYALINNDTCLCTNKPMKDEENDVTILTGQDCSQQCLGNYFYSCGHQSNSTIYSMYVLLPKCRHGFENAENDQQCVYSHFSTKTPSFDSALSYCQSVGATLAKINEIVEIQDILPESLLHTRLMKQILTTYKFVFVNDTRHYWIDRTSDSPDPNTISDRLLRPCENTDESISKNCIAIQYIPKSNQSRTSHERCISESIVCEKNSAMPVCVDKHLEPQITLVPPISDDNPADTSANITIDHSCNDETNQYHLVDDFCYKIISHEVGWNEAKAECQRDNAIIFVPEKSVSLQYIKSLYIRQRMYTSTGIAHVGVYYHNINQTVIQYNNVDVDNPLIIPDSNAIYDLCEKTFKERYVALMSSDSLTTTEKNLIKQQQMGCAYIDLTSNAVPVIRCDEVPCNRTATIICQKSPSTKSSIIKAKREYVIKPSTADVKKPTSASSLTTTVGFSDDETTTIIQSNDQFENDSSSALKSIGRDYAPLFFILAILFAFLLLGFLSALHNRRGTIFHRSPRRNLNSVYSQLTSANDFDLN
ncbi:hypothetical protein I4U23_018755 [Adineta vaga]|nr:hypothetical protein I4U23_018755 [Adineta vaga]